MIARFVNSVQVLIGTLVRTPPSILYKMGWWLKNVVKIMDQDPLTKLSGSVHADTNTQQEYNLFHHKQWIQCISNVSKIGIFLQWKNIVFFH